MSSVKTRLSGLLGHLATPEAKDASPQVHRINYHTLSPTFFLPRAAAIEPDVRTFLLQKKDFWFQWTDWEKLLADRLKPSTMSLQTSRFCGGHI